jgi:hypothetical protein
MIGIVIAFAMSAINLPFALTASPSVSWLNWLVCGFCAGLGVVQVMYRVMDR